jgi:methionyl aminopeptidase
VSHDQSFQIFTPEQIESLRTGGKILSDCLQHVASLVKPGVSTMDLDQAAEAFIRSKGGLPAFKGYHGFPATLCTSVDDEVVHGIPSAERILREGESVSLDGGVIYGGLYTDSCVTVPVGAIRSEIQTFLRTISETLEYVVAEVVRAGIHVGDISSAIERRLRKSGYAPVPTLTGHGLGTHLHQFPDVPNVGKRGTGPILPVGTMIAIEPIAVMGSPQVFTAQDQWTIITSDHSIAGHFEHSVLITEQGCEVIA